MVVFLSSLAQRKFSHIFLLKQSWVKYNPGPDPHPGTHSRPVLGGCSHSGYKHPSCANVLLEQGLGIAQFLLPHHHFPSKGSSQGRCQEQQRESNQNTQMPVPKLQTEMSQQPLKATDIQQHSLGVAFLPKPHPPSLTAGKKACKFSTCLLTKSLLGDCVSQGSPMAGCWMGLCQEIDSLSVYNL